MPAVLYQESSTPQLVNGHQSILSAKFHTSNRTYFTQSILTPKGSNAIAYTLQAKQTKKGTGTISYGIARSPSGPESTRTWAYRWPFGATSMPSPGSRRATCQTPSGCRKGLFTSCRIFLIRPSIRRRKIGSRPGIARYSGYGVSSSSKIWLTPYQGTIPARLATNHTSYRRPARPTALSLKSIRFGYRLVRGSCYRLCSSRSKGLTWYLE